LIPATATDSNRHRDLTENLTKEAACCRPHLALRIVPDLHLALT
jgi:hypothetical protein